MPLATRHQTLFGTKYNGTTSATNLGSPNHLDDLGAQTIISVCRENGDHGGNLGYLYSKGAGGLGPRFLLGSGVAGQTRTGLGFHSSGSIGNPVRAGTVGEYVRGEHLFIAGTWDGSLNATGINIYLSRNGSTSKEVTYGTSTNGVTAVAADAAETVFVGNRSDSLRTVNGDIHYVAVCKGRLSYTQIETVRQHGPFAVNADWRLIFSNGIDYSQYNTRPATITDLSLGRNSPYPFFKRQSIGVVFSAAAALAGAAADVATAAGGITTQIPVAGVAVSVATATGSMTTGISVAVAATVQALASGALSAQITFSGTALASALASGDLTAGSGLAGNAAATANALGSLTTGISLQGAAIAQALAAGGLTVGAGLFGAATGQAAATGQIITGIPLVGAAQAYASGAGNITTLLSLAGTAAAINTATGALTVSITMEGNALAQALASGQITVQIKLDGAALARAAATGALTNVVTYAASASRTRLIYAEYRTRTLQAEYRTRPIPAEYRTRGITP